MMIERNQPCPCGSGKKHKKCCGAAGKAAASGGRGAPAAAGGQGSPAAVRPGAPAATQGAGPAGEARPFLVHTGRGLDAERTESDRRKHLRRRIQETELRGTLAYNNGAFFRNRDG